MSAPLEEPDVHGMRYAGTVIVETDKGLLVTHQGGFIKVLKENT